MSRKEAFAEGKPYYLTGKPCVRGHIAVRFARGACVKCESEYSREYAAKNPEKARERGRRWDKKHRAKRESQWAARRSPEKIEAQRAKDRARYKKNPDKALAANRKWKSDPANREKANAASRDWHRRTPEKSRANNQRRRALKLGSLEHYTAQELTTLRARVGHKCAECLRRKKTTIDHITPLSRGGSNSIRNIQFLCLPCNLRKNAKDPIEFARSAGRLL